MESFSNKNSNLPLNSPGIDSDSSDTSSYFPITPIKNHHMRSTSVSSRRTCARIASLFAESHPAHHVLVLSYDPSEGNLQLEGTVVKDAGAQSMEYDRVLYASEDGDRLYRVFVFSMGRFKFESESNSLNTYAFATNSTSPSLLGGHIFFDPLILLNR